MNYEATRIIIGGGKQTDRILALLFVGQRATPQGHCTRHLYNLLKEELVGQHALRGGVFLTKNGARSAKLSIQLSSIAMYNMDYKALELEIR